MFDKFIRGGNYARLKNSIEEGKNISVFGLNLGEKLALFEDSAFLFYVVENEDSALQVIECLHDIGKHPLFLSNALDPLDIEFESSEKVVSILDAIASGECDALVITPSILSAQFPCPERITNWTIKIGDEIDMSHISHKLIDYGYQRVDIVSSKGEFSLRGDVLDIFPLRGEPTRIMSDFDVVNSIRRYNPITLLTTSELQECRILSNNIIHVVPADIDSIYSNLKLKKDELYYDLIECRSNDYRLIPFDNGFKSSIFDYVQDAVVAFDGAKGIYDKLEKYLDDYRARVKESSMHKILLPTLHGVQDYCKFSDNLTLVAFHYINQNNRLFKPQQVYSIRTLPAVNYTNNFSALELDLANFVGQGYSVIMCAGSNENAVRLQSKLSKSYHNLTIVSRFSQCEKGVSIVARKYPLNIILPEDKLVVIADTSLFGKPKKIVEVHSSFVDGEVPNEGDYVVHNFHGVGKCLGVKTLVISAIPRDYVVIEYKGSDKVYLPVENMNQLSKYIGGDKEPKINKIGGVEFAKTKERVKTAVKKIAFDLVALYRDRMNKNGFTYLPDNDLQLEFEKGFGFAETVDQIKAIDDCKLDMESGKVMDRLVCGDVGFGKTEVALRVAFKTVMAGKQVAFMCPTTILSEQHYNTAKARMSAFGVKVEVLNRLRSSQDVERIKKEFNSGKIDILCGTHKLLASDICYSNLGLLILDEEQKFGVGDKEKIKNIKTNVNVLTLSATPIPRTLNMSLMGVRDISVIETPPVQRLPSDVQVIEYSDIVVKSAIERELSRNGQVLVIYNKVEDIHQFAAKVKALSPNDTNVSVAHGQMDEKSLEKEILALYTGKTQVLVSTTLIENGVDLPNANTLIVIDADKLGLSQLYQLKGRIGRSDKYSYAYFTFSNCERLSDNSYKRLQAIKEFSEMGSGFKIAMRDLEIRGAGSLLGAEQSGHIEKIGYNMYVDIINESVKELRGEEVIKKTDIKVESLIPAFLPHDYINSASRRMSIYKDISNIDSIAKLDTFINRTNDIYGTIPEELMNLSKIACVKNYLSTKGVVKLVVGNKSKMIFDSKESITPELVNAVREWEDCANFNFADSTCVEINMKNGDNVLDKLINFAILLGNF